MKLPKPKYDITILDRVHFFIPLVIGFILGTIVYHLVYGIVQLFENQRFMNSDDKVYQASLGIQILIVILNIIFVHIGPLVFQSIFLRGKAGDHYEESDSDLMWLSKGLRLMVPPCLIFYAIITAGYLLGIYQVIYFFMPGYNFMQIMNLLFGNIMYTSMTAASVFYIVCPLIYLALHTSALLFIFRYFWKKWKDEQDIGRVTMSADAYSSYTEEK